MQPDGVFKGQVLWHVDREWLGCGVPVSVVSYCIQTTPKLVNLKQ